MTYEEVKRIRNGGQIEHANIRELQELIDIAIEKQIPKKPSGTLTISGISRYKSGVCKCGTAIAMVYKYCPNCGQSIDWSEGEFDCSQA